MKSRLLSLALVLMVTLGLLVAPAKSQTPALTESLANAYLDGINQILQYSWFVKDVKPSRLYESSTKAMASVAGTNVIPPATTGDSRKDQQNAVAFFKTNVMKFGTPQEQEAFLKVALEGLLDPWDNWMSAMDPHWMLFTLAASGFTDEGDGIVTSDVAGGSVIDAILTDSPSTNANLKIGDLITAVNGIPLEKITPSMMYKFERDARRSGKITYTVKRGANTSDVVVDYARRPIPEVESNLIDQSIGYIKIPAVDLGTGHEVVDAVDALTTKGAKSIIIDVRSNPGGFVWDAQVMISVFRQGPLYIRRSKEKSRIIQNIAVDTTFQGAVAILVNKGSASAAELMTLMMKGRPNTRIFGENTRFTYGKGVGQEIFKLSNGWFFEFTTTELDALNGVSYHGKGVEADEVVLKTTGSPDDLTLKKATEWLKKQ